MDMCFTCSVKEQKKESAYRLLSGVEALQISIVNVLLFSLRRSDEKTSDVL